MSCWRRLLFKSRLGEQQRNLSTYSNWQSILLIPVLLMFDAYKLHKPGENQCRLHPWAGCNLIDNNSVKNVISPNAHGKKNCLFTSSNTAAQRVAANQTLARHSQDKLNGLDLVAWLRDVLKKLPTWPNCLIVNLLSFARPVEDFVTKIENDG